MAFREPQRYLNDDNQYENLVVILDTAHEDLDGDVELRRNSDHDVGAKNPAQNMSRDMHTSTALAREWSGCEGEGGRRGGVRRRGRGAKARAAGGAGCEGEGGSVWNLLEQNTQNMS